MAFQDTISPVEQIWLKLKRNPSMESKEILSTLDLCFSAALTLAVNRRAKDSLVVQLKKTKTKNAKSQEAGDYLRSLERICPRLQNLRWWSGRSKVLSRKK